MLRARLIRVKIDATPGAVCFAVPWAVRAAAANIRCSRQPAKMHNRR
jgi:hypothetical protein